MAEERITEVRSPDGNAATHTTTIIDDGRSSGGGAGWMIALVLIAALAVGIWFLSNMSRSQSAKDNAVAAAAQDVGDAAKDVGNAAKDAAGSLEKQ